MGFEDYTFSSLLIAMSFLGCGVAWAKKMVAAAIIMCSIGWLWYVISVAIVYVNAAG